ncbi:MULTISPECIES: hypothetical protein [Pectobacterium]|uniref:hypothetical protein n=1 Tax=Pectobacterium TaxID=122277 RepID=UPI000AE41C20|nr:hypothetical protein [Pectobacterium odoriferum]
MKWPFSLKEAGFTCVTTSFCRLPNSFLPTPFAATSALYVHDAVLPFALAKYAPLVYLTETSIETDIIHFS